MVKDRKTWCAVVDCVTRVTHNLVTEQQQIFSLGLSSYETLCTSSKSKFSVFHSTMKFLQDNSTVLQNQTLCCLLFPLLNPQPGELEIGLRHFTSLWELLWYNYFSVCELLTYCVWDLIYHSYTHPTISFWIIFLLMLDFFFFFCKFQCLLLLMVI